MVDKAKMKDDLRELKSMTEDLKTATVQAKDDNELIDIEEQHCFFHTLIDFMEPVDEYSSRGILPAFPNKKCCIPIPSDSGFFDMEEPHYMKLYRGANNKKII